jgi:hypothetical protein
MIIGLAGKAGSGKDSFADVLVEKMGFEKLFFAKNLKEMCKSVFDLTDWHVYEQEGKETKFENPVILNPYHLANIFFWITEKTPDVKVNKHGLSLSIQKFWESGRVTFDSPRVLLQFVGTEICRECYSKDYHIDVVHAQIKDKDYVISDARFTNEREVIKKWEGFNLKIIDPDQEEGETVGLSGHASESEMDGDDFDVVFMNDKQQGLATLEFKAQTVVKDLKEQVFGKHS